MGGADIAAAQVHRGGRHLLRPQQLHGVAHAGDIRHRVQGSHLVEVDLPHLHTVGLGLRLGQQAVDLLRLLPHALRQVKAVDHGGDLRQRGVVVAHWAVVVVVFRLPVIVVMPMGIVVVLPVVVVVMAVLLLPCRHHLGMGAGNAAGGRRLKGHRDLRMEAVHGLRERRLVRQQLIKGPQEHIPRGPHIALQVQRPHASTPFIWLIRLARKPAPNPLSIFTTLTPLAQPLSMDSRALRPPKLAP